MLYIDNKFECDDGYWGWWRLKECLLPQVTMNWCLTDDGDGDDDHDDYVWNDDVLIYVYGHM